MGTSPAPTTMTQHADDDKARSRHDSLRLSGFDYAARRVYFVTIVVSKRRNLFLDPNLAESVINCLLDLRRKMGFTLYSYCLMPDHFHALIGAGESNKGLGEICGAFKSLSTRAYWQRYEGRLWQRQFFDHIIRNEKDFFETMEYIRQNPVRKGLVNTAEEWPYSGIVDELQ
ncbi:MAG TPA: transposase [Blastocatellia bacterium]|nr:transposase [Blastocatellia bacterium]